ncbi:hypothetical protein PPGU16_14490 [Paraburkholderia largidicola]|uniref:Uncharacterized protein n=1 Tax=Paraburkholderia largidicola TaxID=3014751 RepID=A0A7I8BIC7_9BURK|nr:hypothetical protein PPGU16_14490 [Paraburkholderia sp. PGU16]
MKRALRLLVAGTVDCRVGEGLPPGCDTVPAAFQRGVHDKPTTENPAFPGTDLADVADGTGGIVAFADDAAAVIVERARARLSIPRPRQRADAPAQAARSPARPRESGERRYAAFAATLSLIHA